MLKNFYHFFCFKKLFDIGFEIASTLNHFVGAIVFAHVRIVNFPKNIFNFVLQAMLQNRPINAIQNIAQLFGDVFQVALFCTLPDIL